MILILFPTLHFLRIIFFLDIFFRMRLTQSPCISRWAGVRMERAEGTPWTPCTEIILAHLILTGIKEREIKSIDAELFFFFMGNYLRIVKTQSHRPYVVRRTQCLLHTRWKNHLRARLNNVQGVFASCACMLPICLQTVVSYDQCDRAIIVWQAVFCIVY